MGVFGGFITPAQPWLGFWIRGPAQFITQGVAGAM